MIHMPHETAAIDPPLREGIRRMIRMHSINSGAMPVIVAGYLGRIEDGRSKDECSRQAG
jgi:hypothetical protein